MSPCELKVLNRVSNFVRKNFKRSGGGEGTVGSRILYFDIFMSLMNTGICFDIFKNKLCVTKTQIFYFFNEITNDNEVNY